MCKNIKVGDYVRILDVNNIKGGERHWENDDVVRVVGEDSVDLYVDSSKQLDDYYYIRKASELDYVEKVNKIEIQTVKQIKLDNYDYGIIGESTNKFDSYGNELYVGDTVVVKYYGSFYSKVIVKDGDYGLYGFGANRLDIFDMIKKVISHNHLTEDMINDIQGMNNSMSKFEIVEVEFTVVKEMTLKEIEQKLGYKIKIVDNKEEY